MRLHLTIVLVIVLLFSLDSSVFAREESLQLRTDPSWTQITVVLRNGERATYQRSDIIDILYIEPSAPEASPSFGSSFTTGRTFSGEAYQGSKMWPFKIRITDYDASAGSIAGELTWTSLNSVHRIRGTLSGNRLDFTEVEAIQKGGAHLNVSYSMTLSGDEARGTWVDHGDKSTGTAMIMNR